VRPDAIYIKVYWTDPTWAPKEFRLFGFEVEQGGWSQVGRPIYSGVIHQDTNWVANEDLWIWIPIEVWTSHSRKDASGYSRYQIDFPTSQNGGGVAIRQLNFAQRHA
jgi:hypothetical protein